MRIEYDSLGAVQIPDDAPWGPQTQRSLENFRIGCEKIPPEIIRAFAFVKKAAALVNRDFGKLSDEKCGLITSAADKILAGEPDGAFPLSVWQTGSGTQTNMNVNEVIARLSGGALHPNDDVNMSQSSNDTFPTALHVAAVEAVENRLIPAVHRLEVIFERLERENEGVIKSGRTHLQDATPITFSQEISGWRYMLVNSREQIEASLEFVRRLAIGGTAVGTGINAPKGFDSAMAEKLTELTGHGFVPDENKFHALTSKDAITFSHGAFKALAANLMKIANDVRWLASGPRLGLGEITIPANEPGSSIMPGKVNPTQCEALTMLCAEVMGNDATVGFAASQGNFELNVFITVIAFKYFESLNLLADGMDSFGKNCAAGIKADRLKMRENLDRSLMNVTALSPVIGYENAAKVAKAAHETGETLREAALRLGFMTAEEFDEIYHPEQNI